MKSAQYNLSQNWKGVLENGCSAGEASGIYSIEANHSVCVDAMIIVNCEGTNTDDPLIAARSTFHH
jgi:hypothetical protein